jgi:hypothetical protein
VEKNRSAIHIGIDFDNSIVDYGDIFRKRAFERGYLSSTISLSKEEVKIKIKSLSNGEQKWGVLQAEVYSEGINGAVIMKGFSSFVAECRRCHLPLSIISHKSKHNPYDLKRRNLQYPALDWMKKNRFFDKGGYAFTEDRVFLLETLEDKVGCIKTLNCSHFIDDLRKVLNHSNFPKGVKKILFSPEFSTVNVSRIDFAGNWEKIRNYIFQDEKSGST